MKFSLQKYTGAASRFVCPQCKKNHVFCRYVDEQGNTLADDVGRCNRESKCGYHYTPKMWATDHPLHRQRSVQHYTTFTPKPKRVEPSFINFEYVKKSQSTRNNFFVFLRSLFSDASLTRINNDYHLGSTRDGRVVFWQIDQDQKVRTGKVINYNPCTGKRVKASFSITWAHTLLEKEGKLTTPFVLNQCLFGLHLLNDSDNKIIAVVESEKTACIMSGLMPEITWLATGGKSNINAEKLQPLYSKKVVFHPDYDGYDTWKTKINEINKSKNWRVSDLILRLYPEVQNSTIETFDLADIAITEIKFGTANFLTTKITDDFLVND